MEVGEDLFSWPRGVTDVGEGEADGCPRLPESGVALKARLRGLFGEARARANGRDDTDDVLADLAERSESRTLGRRGVRRDDW